MYLMGDPTFVLIILVMIVAMIVQRQVVANYRKYAKVRNLNGLSGAEAARIILDSNGLNDVQIEPVRGELTDHYDPRTRTVRLSAHNYSEPSVSAITIAAHECGHALQHAENYAPLSLRASILPVANIGSHGAFPLFLMGFLFSIGPLMDLGIILFAGALLFHLITLPVEFNASRRAFIQLEQANIIEQNELPGAHKVLNSAALTYVASTLMALVQLIRLIILRGNRN